MQKVTVFIYSVSVGEDTLFCTEGCNTVIDTGSSYITGPASSVSLLMKTIGAVELAEGGVSSVHFMKLFKSVTYISLLM